MCKKTIQEIKDNWLPVVVSRSGGRGLLKKLMLELSFAIGKQVGNLLAMAKAQKELI